MRYAKDHKEQTRRRVVETAGQAFRRDGIVASGVVGLMAQAGMTQGGFYTHFASKDALVEEALEGAQKDTLRKLAQLTRRTREEGGSPIAALIEAYLSPNHLDKPEKGCTLASVGPEMGRQSDAVRRSSYRVMEDTVEVLAAEMPAAQQALAPALYGLLAGTMQLARLAGTRGEQLSILEAGRKAACLVAGCAAEDEGVPSLRAVNA